MKKIILLLLLLLSTLTNVVAQPNSSRCVTFLGADGQGTFFKPHKVPSDNKDVRFEYDMTYIEKKDSITLNFSFITKDMKEVESMHIQGDGKTLKPLYQQRLFIELLGEKFITRIHTVFNFNKLRDLLSNSNSVSFIVVTKDKTYTNTYKKSDWKKERIVFNKIFYLTQMLSHEKL